MRKLLSLNSVLLLVKLLSVAYTARDTYAIAHDLLAVALIDAAFLAMWLVVAYGRGDRMLALRPFAAIGAMLMYALMVAIGLEAHTGLQAIVAFAARVAIAVMLLHDSWDYVVWALQRIRSTDLRATVDDFMRREDERAQRRAYRASMRKLKVSELQTAVNAVAGKRIALFASNKIADEDSIAYNVHTNLHPPRARRDVTPQLRANLHTNFAMDGQGHAICNVCNWHSNGTKAASDVGRAYSAHTRSRTHLAALMQLQVQASESAYETDPQTTSSTTAD